MTSTGSKTMNVQPIIDYANLVLEFPDLSGDTNGPARRQGVCSMLEAILQATGNYRGYNFQADQWLPGSESFKLRTDYDDTRRIYYGAP